MEDNTSHSTKHEVRIPPTWLGEYSIQYCDGCEKCWCSTCCYYECESVLGDCEHLTHMCENTTLCIHNTHTHTSCIRKTHLT